MAKKPLISMLVACVSIGAGIIVLGIFNGTGTYTLPPDEQYQSAAPAETSSKQEQRPNPRTALSTPHNSLPKADPPMRVPAPQQRRHNALSVEITNGEVTLHVENQSLKKVLDMLAHESGVWINTQLIGDRLLSIEIIRTPLDRVLQTILTSEDSFFAFESHSQSQAALKAVWVVPSGTGGQWPPQTSGCMNDLSTIEQHLASTHASQRAEAIETLIDLQGPEAVPAVVRSLEDQNDDVRYRALQKAYRAGVVLPSEVLGALVQHDPSELVRVMAVEAIGNHPSMDAHEKMIVARDAINDGSPAVQTRASEIISHLEATPFMREQDEWLYDEAYQKQTEELQDESMNTQAE